MVLKEVCVFCASNNGNDSDYKAHMEELGFELARRGITLVYGGGNVGLMSVVAQACHEKGGKVVGIIPRFMMTGSVMTDVVGEQIVVSSMDERKREMCRRSDAFISGPGGFGTLEELFEVITLTQLGIQHKPVGLYNVKDYYSPLIGVINKAVEAGFVPERHRQIVVSEHDPARLLDSLEKHDLPIDTNVDMLGPEVATFTPVQAILRDT